MVLEDGTATVVSGLAPAFAPAFAPASKSHPSPAMLRGYAFPSPSNLPMRAHSILTSVAITPVASPSLSNEGEGKFSFIAAPTFYL